MGNLNALCAWSAVSVGMQDKEMFSVGGKINHLCRDLVKEALLTKAANLLHSCPITSGGAIVSEDSELCRICVVALALGL